VRCRRASGHSTTSAGSCAVALKIARGSDSVAPKRSGSVIGLGRSGGRAIPTIPTIQTPALTWAAEGGELFLTPPLPRLGRQNGGMRWLVAPFPLKAEYNSEGINAGSVL